MPTNPYVILGIEKGATQSEVEQAYKERRDYYQSHIFDEGESGAEAARMITLLDGAYQKVMDDIAQSAEVSGVGESTFENVRSAIREHNPEAAQAALDKIEYRNAEWHYYQSIVFYEKNWLNDSKKQLEIALQMDPSNQKYADALAKLKKKTDGTRPYDKEGSQGVYGQNTATQRTYSQNTAAVGDGCCSACQALLCADCCCECLGGDLIRCC